MNNNRVRRIFIILILCCILAVTFASCRKYLEKKSDDKLSVPTTLPALQGILDYRAVMNKQITPSYGLSSSDEYYFTKEQYNSSAINVQETYKWRAYDVDIESDWQKCYTPIYYSNLALDQLEDIKRNNRNSQKWDIVKGSALFYRSYYFLWLLWDYSKTYDASTAEKDLGIALRMTSDFNVKSIRVSNEQSYNRVIEDIKSSIKLLPELPEYPSQPSKCGAYGLLARCYLSMRDYNKCLLYADSCLQLNSQLMDYNSDAEIIGGVDAKYPFKLFNKETIFYSEINTTQIGYLFANIDSNLMNLYSINDLRKRAFFANHGNGPLPIKGSYTGGSVLFSGLATDEVLLMRAECYVRENQIEKGIEDINTLLKNRYSQGSFFPYDNSSKQQTLDFILLERRKELVMRGLRWMDLKRLNKDGANITLKRIIDGQVYTLKPNSNYYALPLPDDIIKITGMPQNPR